jgi:hypothetical protein
LEVNEAFSSDELKPGSFYREAARRATEMTKTRRMRITIQTERLLVLNSCKSLYSLCDRCGDEVRMVTIDQAAMLARLSSREIYREVEAGMLHFRETAEGSVLICFNSLNGSNLEQERMNG